MKVIFKNLSLTLTTGILACHPLLAEKSHPPQIQSQSHQKTALRIYNKIRPFILRTDINLLSLKGQLQYDEKYSLNMPIPGADKLQARIAQDVLNKKPIKFLLVGFPFKSQNTKGKTLNGHADLAERKSLEYLQEMLDGVRSVYEPGAEIYILCDGLPYANLLKVSNQTMDLYVENLKSLSKDLPNLHILAPHDLKEFGVPSPKDFMSRIELLSENKQTIKDKIARNPKGFNTLLNRLKEEFDYPKAQKYLSLNGHPQIALEMMRLEGGLRLVVQELFPPNQYIRLSVHFTPDITEKVGIKLSPDSTLTPYHGVLYVDRRGRWHIAMRQSLLHKDFVLDRTTINGVDCAFMRPR